MFVSCWLPGLNFIFLFKYGNPDWKPLATNYLGLLLQAVACLACDWNFYLHVNQESDYRWCCPMFGVCLLIFVLGWVTGFNSATWAQVCSYISVNTHMESFGRGVLDLKDALYYVTLTIFGLFLTARSIESLRWRS